MRAVLALVAAAFLSTAAAQPNLFVSPLGVVLSAGKIIYDYDFTREYHVLVKSAGKDERDARMHGFQIAVEYAVGQLIVSETEVKDDVVARKDIIQYSSGFVSRYDVKDKSIIGDETVVVMDVWVKSNKIADRLVNHTKQKNTIDGRNLAAQIKTTQQQSSNGDKVLKAILSDYPTRSFNVTHKDVYAQHNGNRTVSMTIPITFTWNESYLKSVGEALVAINEGVHYKNRKYGYRLVSRLPGIVYSPTYDVWTEDFTRYTMFNDTFTKVGVQVDIFNRAGLRIHSQCEEPQHELALFIKNQIILDGRAKLNHNMVVENMSEEFVETMDKMTITAVKYCKQPLMARR